jgi:hypothetical protein
MTSTIAAQDQRQPGALRDLQQVRRDEDDVEAAEGAGRQRRLPDGRFHMWRMMTKNSRVSTNMAPVTAMP